MKTRGTPQQRSNKFRAIGGIAAGLAATGMGLFAYARYIEPRTLLIRSFELAIPNLPEQLSGTRVAFLSDFHVGVPGHNVPIANRAIEEVERQRPDLIFLGGDFYDQGGKNGHSPDWRRIPAVAPTFGVLGNHDYNAGVEQADAISRTMSNVGITMLRNDARTVTLNGAALDIVGVDDPYRYRADYSRAVKELKGSSNPRLLLAHAGMITNELPVGDVALTLSGHTHGAQIRLSPLKHAGPLDAFWWLDRIRDKRISPYRQGIFWVRGGLLYVGNGIGMTTLRMRFMAPPEVAFLTLYPGIGNPDDPCDTPERYVLRMDTRRVRVPFD